MLRRLMREIKAYAPYLFYSAKCELKSEVANSHLNWLWWILDPLCFMLVYVFISLVVFKKSQPYFPVYVFIGLSVWNFFSKTLTSSVKAVKQNKNIVSKVYFPRYMLVLQTMLIQGFKMMISLALAAVLMVIYRVPISWHVILVIPVFIVLLTITFGFSTILLHFGVYINDLTNVMTVVLRLLMYLSGVFYSIETQIPAPYNDLIMRLNPMANCIASLRKCLLYCESPFFVLQGIWLILGLAASWYGIRLIYKYENSYVKVV